MLSAFKGCPWTLQSCCKHWACLTLQPYFSSHPNCVWWWDQESVSPRENSFPSSMFSGSYKQKGSVCPLSSSLPPRSEGFYLLAPSQTSRISSSDPFCLNFASTSAWSLQTVLTVWPRLDGFVSFSWSGSLPQQRSAGWLWSFCMPGKLHLWHRWDVRHL